MASMVLVAMHRSEIITQPTGCVVWRGSDDVVGWPDYVVARCTTIEWDAGHGLSSTS